MPKRPPVKPVVPEIIVMADKPPIRRTLSPDPYGTLPREEPR